MFNFENTSFPNNVCGFEDLSFLFWSSPLNRGIIRQDIDEAAELFKTVNKIKNAHGIEIGRFNGGSTILLALAVGKKGKLISFDIDPINDIELIQVLKKYTLFHRVKLLVERSDSAKLYNKLDFVFIDGDHSYEAAKQDHNIWGSQVKPNMFIIHHDMGNTREYSSQWSDLKRLREEIITKQKGIVFLYKEVGSLSIFKRTSRNWVNI
jgi:hypothetical protein